MPPVSAPEPQASPPLPGSRRLYRLETLVFLLVLLPWMGFALAGASPERLDFALVAVVIMLHDLALTALALYLVWRGGEGLGAIGWSGRKAGREALLGVALFVPLFAAVALIQVLLRAAGCAEPSPPPAFLLPDTAEERALALLFLPVVAVAEETVFRGYLLHRLCQASGSRAVAVVLSTVIFAFGHTYQGALGTVAVALIGAAFALVFLWRWSLVAPVVMHFIQNFLGLLVAPRFLY
jgi:membrane protease YdiL (CAAX protease family)